MSGAWEAASLLEGVGDTFCGGGSCELMGSKGKKVASRGTRFVAAGKFALYLLQGNKVVAEHSILSIRRFESHQPDELRVYVRDGPVSSDSSTGDPPALWLRRVEGQQVDFDALVYVLRKNVRELYPGAFDYDRFYEVDVKPAERVHALPPVSPSLANACDSFSDAYLLCCHKHNRTPPLAGIARLCDERLRFFTTREFNLADFAGVRNEPRQFGALVSALQYNRWFRRIVITDAPVLRFAVAEAMQSNGTVTDLVLRRVGALKDDAVRLATLMTQNENLKITCLDVSKNLIEDRGLNALSNWLSRLSHGIESLNVAECGAGKQGMSLLLATLENHHFHSGTLRELILSNNRLEADGSQNLYRLLKKARRIDTLGIAQMTGLAVETVFPGADTLGGLCETLVQLDLSQNRLPAAIDDVRKVGDFLQHAKRLQRLSLAGTLMPADALVALVGKASHLRELDVSNNPGIADDVALLTGCLMLSTSLNTLRINGTVKPKSKRGGADFVTELIRLCNSACPIMTLHVAAGTSAGGAPLREQVLPLLEYLGADRSLVELRINGHQFGDAGARVLARSLERNRTLRTLDVDENALTIDGFAELDRAVAINEALSTFYFPYHDVAAERERLGKDKNATSSVDEFDALLHRLQRLVANPLRAGKPPASAYANLLTDVDLERVRRHLLDGVGQNLGASLPPHQARRTFLGLTHRVLSGTTFASHVHEAASASVADIVCEWLSDLEVADVDGVAVSRTTGESVSVCQGCAHGIAVDKVRLGVVKHQLCEECLQTVGKRIEMESTRTRAGTMMGRRSPGVTPRGLRASNGRMDRVPAESPRGLSRDSLAAANSVQGDGKETQSESDSARAAVAAQSNSLPIEAMKSPKETGGAELGGKSPDRRQFLSRQLSGGSQISINRSPRMRSNSNALLLRRRSSVDGEAIKSHHAESGFLRAGSNEETVLAGDLSPRLASTEVDLASPLTSPRPVYADDSVDVGGDDGAAAAAAAAAAALTGSGGGGGVSGRVQRPRNKGNKKVDKFGFEVDTLKRQRTKQTIKQMEKDTERAEKWALMISDWDKWWSKQRERVRKRFRKGLPDTLRGPLWRLIGECDAMKEKYSGLYASLCERESVACGTQISLDIHRTFPQHVFFKDVSGIGQQGLTRILNAFAEHDPACGYTQGMGFVAGLLLMFMGEEDAFYMLLRFMDDYKLRGLYLPGFPTLHEWFYVHDELMKQYLPTLHAFFEENSMSTSLYATQWYSTIFVYALPFHLVIRIWDAFLVDRLPVVFGAAIALLKIHQSTFLKSPFEEVMETLFHLNQLELDANELIDTIYDLKIPESRIEQLAAEFWEKHGDEQTERGEQAKRDIERARVQAEEKRARLVEEAEAVAVAEADGKKNGDDSAAAESAAVEVKSDDGAVTSN